MELLNDKKSFEITYHDPVDPSLSADQMHTHNNNALPNEWPYHWNLQTQYYFAEHDVASLTWA